jgi:hypothetical protein
LPTKTRVYGAAVWLGCRLVLAGSAEAQPDLDCARRAEARALLGRLQLAEIEGAEDVHRAAMWEAFGRCPGGAAGEPCRAAEGRRFGADWDRKKRAIEAKYRALLAEFEQRCRGTISRPTGQSSHHAPPG